MNSIEEVVYYSSWLQCEGYKAVFEEGRGQWPHCSMAINWCYNEPWITAAGNSILVILTAKNSLRSVLATARIQKFAFFEFWYHNDNPFAVSDTMNVTVELADKNMNYLHGMLGKFRKILISRGGILPIAEDAKEITVQFFSTSQNANNNYHLLYRCGKKSNFIRELNK